MIDTEATHKDKADESTAKATSFEIPLPQVTENEKGHTRIDFLTPSESDLLTEQITNLVDGYNAATANNHDYPVLHYKISGHPEESGIFLIPSDGSGNLELLIAINTSASTLSSAELANEVFNLECIVKGLLAGEEQGFSFQNSLELALEFTGTPVLEAFSHALTDIANLRDRGASTSLFLELFLSNSYRTALTEYKLRDQRMGPPLTSINQPDSLIESLSASLDTAVLQLIDNLELEDICRFESANITLNESGNFDSALRIRFNGTPITFR